MSHICKPERERLAQSTLCNVERCTCGVWHVTVGPLTLRLEPDVVASLWCTLDEAIQRVGTTTPSARVLPHARVRGGLS